MGKKAKLKKFLDYPLSTVAKMEFTPPIEEDIRRVASDYNKDRAAAIAAAIQYYGENVTQELVRYNDHFRLGKALVEHLLSQRMRGTQRVVRTSFGKLRERKELIAYSEVIIASLQEVLDYDPVRHHNRPTPALYIDDADYLQEVRSLVAELQILNKAFEARQKRKTATRQQVVHLAKHLDVFLGTYAKAMGKGAAALTTGAIAAWLYHAGVGKDLIDTIWGHLKLPK